MNVHTYSIFLFFELFFLPSVFTFINNERADTHLKLGKNKLNDRNQNFSCTVSSSWTSLIKRLLTLDAVSTIFPSTCWVCSGLQCRDPLNAFHGRNTYSGMRFIQTNYCKVKNGVLSLSCDRRESTSKIPTCDKAPDSNIILMTFHDNMTLAIVFLINHSCDTPEIEFETLKNITISLPWDCIKQQEEERNYDSVRPKRLSVGYASSLKRSAQKGGGKETETQTTSVDDVVDTATTMTNSTGGTTENVTTATEELTTTELPERYIGKSLVYLEGDDMVCRYRECNTGNLICDAMIKYVAYHTSIISGIATVYWSNATIALLNGGLINQSITATKDGFITNKQIREAITVNDPVYIFWLKAQELKDTIERSVTISEAQNYDNFLQVSGIYYKYDLNRPRNSRIIDIRTLCQDCEELMYIPLNYSEDVNYKLVGTHSLVKDALGDHTIIRDHAQKNIRLELKLIEIIEWHFEQYSPILSGIENRITSVEPMMTADGSKIRRLHIVSLHIILLSLYCMFGS